MSPLVTGLIPLMPPKCHSPSQTVASNLHQQTLEAVQFTEAEANLIKRQHFGERVCQQNERKANSTTFYDNLHREKGQRKYSNSKNHFPSNNMCPSFFSVILGIKTWRLHSLCLQGNCSQEEDVNSRCREFINLEVKKSRWEFSCDSYLLMSQGKVSKCWSFSFPI